MGRKGRERKGKGNTDPTTAKNNCTDEGEGTKRMERAARLLKSRPA
jgi:hypothetical protein